MAIRGAVRHVRGTRSPQTALCAAGITSGFAPGARPGWSWRHPDFDEALDALRILYHHVPSVTGMPVWLGRLDHLLLPPFVGELDDETLHRKLKAFWIYLDRVLPDAFMHVNIGPDDNRICRLILRIDRELQQVAPNLSLFHDPVQTPDSLLLQGVENISACSKPHIVNYPLHRDTFDERGFGIVSCYNALPWGRCQYPGAPFPQGRGRAERRVEDFMARTLPHYCEQASRLIEARPPSCTGSRVSSTASWWRRG